ncbi:MULTISPECIES: outer membrane protein assembly factor BamB family protein [Streptomyces]|uniref:Outer membrane protein assembly factor BamB n=1 Tax=Streptomyces murinus TaxID=33900 RepID=A0A7W3RNP0_STRMR|nr:PQQ-binding-like beta-propeller repeat protein [Streptomyces murinus]MBA9056397.1 outer membrane protein assembly factor BamB [Streptomyces murinus]UWW90871.1 PQQ-binding-like beta-propeller repeat protein [Streptomyces murinus]WSI88102.1 PQQ-like beta-propeller repeat protein [Streptomyces murinus]
MSFGPPPSMYTQSALAADQTRSRRRRRLFLVLAAVVAFVLCLGGSLIWYHSAGRTGARDAKAMKQAPDDIRETVEKAPVSPEGRLVTEHFTAVPSSKPVYAPGTWATGKVVARAVADWIEGYKIGTDYDKTAWKLRLDGHVCAVSRDVTADGRTAVVVQPPPAGGSGKAANSDKEGVCDEVVMVDLNTGKRLWQRKMPSADFAFVTNTGIALTRGVVAVAWGQGSVAYDMDSGKRLWNTTLATSQCHDSGFAGGRALLALVLCGESTDARYRVEKLDPRTGKVIWRYSVSNGIQAVYLPSADPPVLAVEAGDTVVTDLLTLDPETGRRRATISMRGYDTKCGQESYPGPFFGVLDKCDGMVVGRDRAFVMSKENLDDDKPADSITAFDLAKGTKAEKFEGRPLQTVVPVRMNGDDLIIYRDSSSSVQPAAVVDWNPRTDKETPYLLFSLPTDEEYELSDPEQSDILYEQGHAFLANRMLERDEDSPKDPVLSLIGVGTAGLKH